MTPAGLRSIVIVGGGTAGWMAAACLSRVLAPQGVAITLVESEEIGTVGVGEATVPPIRQFNSLVGIDESRFVAETNGTFKLGIEFRDWLEPGSRFFHGFGDYGDPVEGIAPHHFWLRLREAGEVTALDAHSLTAAIAERGRFAPPAGHGLASQYRHAFHFDAALYARFLRKICEGEGVRRIEGKVVETLLDPGSGAIRSITLADGRSVAGDFYIDCSGFTGLLIERALGTGYEEWNHWLPCDSAVVVPATLAGPPAPFTTSTAREAGWQWRIPLQHREGNGYVYASRFSSDERAQAVLLDTLPGKPLADPRVLRFVTGHRRRFWNRNCLALGLASGFLEPLESTSIQLIHSGIVRFLEFLPDRRCDPVLADEYNRVTANEYARIRDFLILHYCRSRRSEPLWEHCRSIALPDTLVHKLEVWLASGRVPLLSEESYQEPSWAAILLGNGVVPRRYDPLADRHDLAALSGAMAARRQAIARLADSLPLHQFHIDRHCKSGTAA